MGAPLKKICLSICLIKAFAKRKWSGVKTATNQYAFWSRQTTISVFPMIIKSNMGDQLRM